MENTDSQIEFIKQTLDKPVVLVGLMGAGKSTIGKNIAKTLNHAFVDSDHVLVDNEKRSIAQIFDEEGEAYFREKERETIEVLIKEIKPHIIGIGGGAFMNDQTRQLILKNSISIFLQADIDVLTSRVGQGKGRPLLEGKETQDVLVQLMTARYPIYSQATLTVDTIREGVKQTADKVLNSLYNYLARD